MATGVLMISATDDPEELGQTYALAAVCTFYGGAIAVTVAGLFALVRLRNHLEFVWFLVLFSGSLLSVWIGIVGTIVSASSPIMLYILSGVGLTMESISLAQMTLFRHDRVRVLWKCIIIAGLALCHVTSLAEMRKNRLLFTSLGISVITVGYTIGRIRSIYRLDSVSLNA